MFKNFKKILILTVFFGFSISSSQALTLRVADSVPVGHYISGNLIEPWMDRVSELTNNEVTFEYYPAEQMGKAKDLLALLQSGAVDMAYIGISYTPDKLPLSAVGELPEAFTESCVGSKAYWELAQPGGLLDKEEISKQGVRMVIEMVLAPYQLMTSKKEIKNLDSFKGLNIRATGGTKELAVERLGGAAVSIPAPETREGLSRGTLDGILFPFSSLEPYGLPAVLKYSTHGLNFGSFISTYMINTDRWNSLSENVKEAMTQAANEVMPKACAAVDALDEKDAEKLQAAGAKLVELDKSEVEKLDSILSGIGEDWAKHLDKSGKPGSKVLQEFRAELDKVNN